MKQKFNILFVVCTIMSFSGFAQTTEQTYYVTIGVYGVHHYAILFTETANKNNFSAQYAINPKRKLYYVYLYSSTDRVKAIAFMLKMRIETDYKDCWVFSGTLGDALLDASSVTPAEKPEVKQDVTKPVVAPEVKPEVMKPVEQMPKKDTTVTTTVVKPDTASKAPVEKPIEKPVVAETPAAVENHETGAFDFKLVNESGEEIVGEVHVQESSKATQYQAFKGNEVVYLKAPVNDAGSYTILTNAPGYEQMKETINFKDPASTSGVVKGDKNEFVVTFTLKRAKHGDYIDFNNVKFIRNSSVMTAESEPELDGLALLMKENPKYKIKIHGHCNGKNDREIVVIGNSTNFFGMDPKNKKETATAKKLSEERAEAVKAYIISKGVEAHRIATAGEGGRIPLYPVNSTLNAYNDRVEIEVKKD